MNMRLIEIARELLQSVETAEVDIQPSETPSAEEQYITYLTAILIRQDKILDERKIQVFADILNIPTKGRCERAAEAYDRQFLLSLNLSLDSTSELAKELILIAKKYNVSIPSAWTDISQLNIDLNKNPTRFITRKKPSL